MFVKLCKINQLKLFGFGIVIALDFELEGFRKQSVEETTYIMSEENNTGNNLIWAITTLIIVAIIAGALYFTVLQGNKSQDKNIDIEIKTPSAPSTK